MAGTAQPIGAENGVRRYQLFINGKFTDSRSGKTFESISPHDRSVVAVVAEGDKTDIDAAVSAARGAYEGVWSTTPPGERAKLLLKIADLLEANSAELGRLETLDMGMPMVMSSAMGAVSADVFRYWAGMATKIHGLTGEPMRPGNYLGYTLREPLGVVGGITPWNGPLLMAAWKTAPALACGNTVVLKPAEHTPMTSLELARLVAEAGLPEGVLNVVPGFGPTAGAAQGPALRRDRQEGGRSAPLRRRAAEGSCARPGVLPRADGVHRGRQQDADRPGGDIRPGGERAPFPRRGRCRPHR